MEVLGQSVYTLTLLYSQTAPCLHQEGYTNLLYIPILIYFSLMSILWYFYLHFFYF